jgi:hypothetical protein
MAKHRTHSVEMNASSRPRVPGRRDAARIERYDLSRNLIRIRPAQARRSFAPPVC